MYVPAHETSIAPSAEFEVNPFGIEGFIASVGVGDGEGKGFATNVGEALGFGVIETPAFQTRTPFFFMHVYFLFLAFAICPIFEHLSPGLTAACVGVKLNIRAQVTTATAKMRKEIFIAPKIDGARSKGL